MSAKDPATDAPAEKDGDEAEAAVVADDEPPAVKHETYDVRVGPFKKGEGARGRALLSSAAVGAMAIEAAQCVMTNFEEDYEPNQWAIKVLWNLAQYGDLPIKLHKANTETTMGKFWDYMENEVVFVQVQIAIKHHCTGPRTEIEHAYDLLQILKTNPDEVKAHAIRLKRERETREEKRRLIKEREALNPRQEASAGAALLRNTHYSEGLHE